MATIIAKLQSQTATKPHRHSHLPMPTEAEMEEIIDIIDKHRNNTQLLKKMEEATPPHIMEALIEFAERRADEAEQWAREVKAWRQEVEELYNSIMQRLTPQQRKEVGFVN